MTLCIRTKIMVSLRWAFRCGTWQPTAEEWTLGMACVQAEERERINRFVFKKDAKSALAGRLLIRKAVSSALRIRYNDIHLDRTDKGKPFLRNTPVEFPHFNFNVSHDGEYAVLAAESSCHVGIDVMRIDRPIGSSSVLKFFDTMSRQFTGQEWSAIKSNSDELRQLHNFYRFWCLKESYVKCVGVGIGYDLQRLEFVVNSSLQLGDIVSDTVLKVDGLPLETCVLQETMLDGTHIATSALEHIEGESVPHVVTSFTVLGLPELLSGVQPLAELNSSYWLDFHNKPERPSINNN